MGLGLAVARRTAKFLGGTIKLAVREDGNTFKSNSSFGDKGRLKTKNSLAGVFCFNRFGFILPDWQLTRIDPAQF